MPTACQWSLGPAKWTTLILRIPRLSQPQMKWYSDCGHLEKHVIRNHLLEVFLGRVGYKRNIG